MNTSTAQNEWHERYQVAKALDRAHEAARAEWNRQHNRARNGEAQ